MSETQQPTILTAPAEGVPPVVETERALVEAARRVAAGTGPVALDAERAAGFRYSGRAYLVQLRRHGSGTVLIDPVACPDLSPIQEAIGDAEWVLHAATQDLPCLAEVGMTPTHLFDTELGSRLAGLPRVGLAAVVEHYLGFTLAKEHSAADWSTRPLPEPWLTYAALDVEVLVEVRDRLRADLEQQGKLDWAMQDFAALTTFTGPPVREDPWRHTSGIHQIRDRRALARVRELWLTRDRIARTRDTAPGRILSDALLVAVAVASPRTSADLQVVTPATKSRASRTHRSSRNRNVGLLRYQRDWLTALRTANGLGTADLPSTPKRSDAPPPMRAWADRNPVAAERLTQVRDQLAEFGEQHNVPLENLVQPDALRRLVWGLSSPAGGASLEANNETGDEASDKTRIERTLSGLGAREWQREIVVPLVIQAMKDHPATDG